MFTMFIFYPKINLAYYCDIALLYKSFKLFKGIYFRSKHIFLSIHTVSSNIAQYELKHILNICFLSDLCGLFFYILLMEFLGADFIFSLSMRKCKSVEKAIRNILFTTLRFLSDCDCFFGM